MDMKYLSEIFCGTEVLYPLFEYKIYLKNKSKNVKIDIR